MTDSSTASSDTTVSCPEAIKFGESGMNGKALIAYFSASGTTARIAMEMADATDADLYEIRPSQPYTEADLDWTNKGSRSTMEMSDISCRPALAEPVPDLSQYDTIIVGFPIWWYVEPRIVDTFLDMCDIAGRTIVPFATSGGSGIERAEINLRSNYPQAIWNKGRLLRSGDAAEWAKGVLLE